MGRSLLLLGLASLTAGACKSDSGEATGDGPVAARDSRPYHSDAALTIEASVPLRDATPADLVVVMEQYVDQVNGYALYYPETWTVTPKQEVLVKADIVKSATTGLQVRIDGSFSGRFEDYADRYVAGFIDDMTSHYAGSEIDTLTAGAVKLGEHNGYVATFFFSRADGAQFLFKSFLFEPHGGRLFFMQAGCLWRDRASDGVVFEIIAGSLRYLDA